MELKKSAYIYYLNNFANIFKPFVCLIFVISYVSNVLQLGLDNEEVLLVNNSFFNELLSATTFLCLSKLKMLYSYPVASIPQLYTSKYII